MLLVAKTYCPSFDHMFYLSGVLQAAECNVQRSALAPRALSSHSGRLHRPSWLSCYPCGCSCRMASVKLATELSWLETLSPTFVPRGLPGHLGNDDVNTLYYSGGRTATRMVDSSCNQNRSKIEKKSCRVYASRTTKLRTKMPSSSTEQSRAAERLPTQHCSGRLMRFNHSNLEA